MPEFHVTFGGQYGSQEYGADPHPILGYEYCHRDGWLTVEAPSYDVARSITTALLWTAWSSIYTAEDHAHDVDLYPRGELLRVDATTADPVRLPEPVLDRLWQHARAQRRTEDRVSGIVTVTLAAHADGRSFYSRGPRVEDDATGGPAVDVR